MPRWEKTRCSVNQCGKQVLAGGLCPAHYRKLKLYGDPEAGKLKQYHGLTLEQRFAMYVGPQPDLRQRSACWEWIGYKDPNGYGRLNINNRPTLAHRIAWELANGKLPPSKQVLHRCDNPSCIRLSHLFVGSPADNVADMWRKNRARPGKSVGEKHGCSKLTEVDVLEIRSSKQSGVDLAKRYGISRANISDVRNHKIWRHI